MGIFSFIKDVGQRLAGMSHAHANEPDSDAVKKTLESHNLGTQDLKVDVKDGKVTLSGDVKDQATLEKAIVAAGNAVGVSEVDTDNVTVSGKPQAEPKFYTVKSGDNLWKIAEAVYGKGQGDKNTLIFEANKPMLTSPDKIYPGQVLRIPPLH